VPACPACEAEEWAPLFERLGWPLVRCRRCGLARLEPLPTEEQLADHYVSRTREGGNYDLARADERRGSLAGVLDFVERVAPRRGALLDVGCFDGGLLDLAAERGYDGWGLEPQGPAADEAERRHPGRITNALLEDAEGLDLGSFDVIAAVGLVEHLRDPGALFRVAGEHLRPGGVLVVQTPDRRSAPARLLGRLWPPIAPPEHVYYFDRRTLALAAGRHALEPVAARRDVKRLRVGYVYEQFAFFGPEIHRLLGPAMRVLPERAAQATLPFYGGETLFAARRA
jgi:SAM-dependent methyltransferase